MEKLSDNLLTRLLTAEVCCKDCGTHFGKYSVGCSSSWYGNCHVCGKYKSVTEVRDYGYLTKGINEEKAKIKEQSKEVAEHIAENENETASYEEGTITCMFTEAEIDALVTVISDVYDKYTPGQDSAFDSAFVKITELYEDHCIKYELSPALKAYIELYGTFGHDSPEDEARWSGFVAAYTLLTEQDA